MTEGDAWWFGGSGRHLFLTCNIYNQDDNCFTIRNNLTTDLSTPKDGVSSTLESLINRFFPGKSDKNYWPVFQSCV